ncbi:sensor histidine kinase [Micrococcoides hystricis]|uniref:Sensor histidine kinase n=1 Tax=Micrococcoides hystricis TaxID=1572761 RepID=A0ABV6PBL5_9MICC
MAKLQVRENKTTVLQFLRGERFIDPPLRLTVLVFAVMSFTPGFFESDQFGYLVLTTLASLLLVFAPFTPLVSALGGLVGYVLFAIVYGEYLNPFQSTVLVALAVLLTEFRWRLFAMLSALLFVSNFVAGSLRAVATGSDNLVMLLFMWLIGAILGLSAGLFERQIRQEIARREELARQNQQQLERLRMQVALDTHDTVSHGLAAEAAIMRMLAADPKPTLAEDSRLTELALVNAHTQQQLRLLLGRLTAQTAHPYADADFKTDLQRAAELIRAATEAGGFELSITIGEVPEKVPISVLDATLFVMKELATNIVKHSASSTSCHLEVSSDAAREMILAHSCNPAKSEKVLTPRSLSTRVRHHGGTCTVENTAGRYLVSVELPIDAPETSTESKI